MAMPEKEMKEMYLKGKKKGGKKPKSFDAHAGANALAARMKGY